MNEGVAKKDRKWTLKAKKPWIGGVTTFYNRVCYDNLVAEMENKKLILVKGTPGIGKTMFLQRLLVDIVQKVQKAANSQKSFPTIDYVRCEKGVTKTYRLLHDGKVILSDDPSAVDYELSDSVDMGSPHGTKYTIEVASNKDRNYKEFGKRLMERKDGTALYGAMELCSLEELKIMNAGMTDKEYQFRYDVFGGSARYFGMRQVGVVGVVSLVEETMKWYFSDEYNDQGLTSVLNIALKVICEEFAKTDKALTFNSLMRHRAHGKEIWASKFMETLAGEAFDRRETSMSDAMMELGNASTFGNLFEVIAHRKLLQCKENYIMYPLYKKFARGVNRDPVKIKFNNPMVRRRKVEDIKSIPTNNYGLPLFTNFPLVDAIVPPATLLQMTVSENNHKGAVAQLETIREQLPKETASRKHRMIFVVPQKNMDTFQYQENLGNICQFVMCPDRIATTKKRKHGDT